VPVWPIGKSGESDDRSDQQEHHNEFRIFNDERNHAMTRIVPEQAVTFAVVWSHQFVSSMTLQKISGLAGKNVSCITDEYVSLIQAEWVKAFPPSLHPRQTFWRGFFRPTIDAREFC
jgi:hypothetical protein